MLVSQGRVEMIQDDHERSLYEHEKMIYSRIFGSPKETDGVVMYQSTSKSRANVLKRGYNVSLWRSKKGL